MSKIIQKKAKLLSNIHLISNYYKLALHLPEIARLARPGQFLMLRINQGYKPFLRRPFSIHRIVYSSQLTVDSKRRNLKEIGIEILYEVVGEGTEILSQKKPGQYLDVLGPLGNGFHLSSDRRAILVGGGIGIAPLFFLAQQLLTVNCSRMKFLKEVNLPTVLIGAKTKRQILSQKEFASLDLDVKISSDDGSVGFKGKATELLKHLLRTGNCELSTIYACGPRLMLKEISIISKQYNIPAQISLDEYMACGLGVCLGCMVQTIKGQKLVCRDGPIFDAAKIEWHTNQR